MRALAGKVHNSRANVKTPVWNRPGTIHRVNSEKRAPRQRAGACQKHPRGTITSSQGAWCESVPVAKHHGAWCQHAITGEAASPIRHDGIQTQPSRGELESFHNLAGGERSLGLSKGCIPSHWPFWLPGPASWSPGADTHCISRARHFHRRNTYSEEPQHGR